MAARAIAAAVFRPKGSVSTRLRADVGNCFFNAVTCSAFVTVQIRSAGISDRSRSTVCSSMVVFPMMFSNCFGVLLRLRGQKRVPRPPARITACTVSDLSDMALSYHNARNVFLFESLMFELCDQQAGIRYGHAQKRRGNLGLEDHQIERGRNEPCLARFVMVCRIGVV